MNQKILKSVPILPVDKEYAIVKEFNDRMDQEVVNTFLRWTNERIPAVPGFTSRVENPPDIFRVY